MNITQIIASQAKIRPNAIALYTMDTILTYRALDELVIQGTIYLHRQGIRSSNIIAHRFNNELNALIAFLSCARLGVTVFSVSVNTPYLMLNEFLDSLDISMVLTDDIYYKFGKYSPLEFEVSLLNHDDYFSAEGIDHHPTKPLLIINGSGTTGKSKFIPLTHIQMSERLKLDYDCLGTSTADVIASMVHFDFYVGKLRVLGSFFVGASYVMLPKNKHFNIAWIDRFNISIFHGGVFHFEQILLDKSLVNANKFISLNKLAIGMSTVSEVLRKRLKTIFKVPLYITYGTNECSALSVFCSDTDADSMSVGCILKGVELEILDLSGEKVKAGEIGNIRVRSAAMVDGYLNDPEATASVFKRGWFYPGDLGRFSENGELIYCGRADHMMIMNGINIYPAEIEAIMCTHPDVNDVASVPFYHPIHQEIPVCAIVLCQESTITVEELLRYGYNHLGVRSPKQLFIVDQIPRTINGKLIRDDLNLLIRNHISKKNHLSIFTQSKRLWTVELVLPEGIEVIRVEQWFNVLNIPIVHVNSTKKHLLHTIFYQGLCLFSYMAQESGIPIFYPGEIVNIASKDKNICRIRIKIADIDHIPENTYQMLVDTAFSTLLKILLTPITPEAITLIHELMHRMVVTLRKKLLIGQSTLSILRTAYDNRIPFFHLGAGIYQIGIGKYARKIDRSTTEKDANLGAKLAHDKALSAGLLRMAGLPSPEHAVVTDLQEAHLAASQLGWPLVVKPSDMERGEGVSVGITNLIELENAFKHARQVSRSKHILIEREISGVCHRLFIVNNTLLYAVKRLPVSVLGDGESTIAELIKHANAAEITKVPWKRSYFPSDDTAQKTIALQGYRIESIPPEGDWIALRDIESTQWGGRDEEVTAHVHPDNLDIALRAAVLCELEVAGIDIITTDISIPWYDNNAIINEINSSPLLGGGEISRGYLNEYLKNLLQRRGKIPIEAFVGGEEAMCTATERFTALRDKGVQCYLSSESLSLSPLGEPIYLPYTAINPRAKALALRKDAEALIFVLQTDEVLHHGFSLGQFDRVTICSERVISFQNNSKNVSTQRFQDIQYFSKNEQDIS